MEDSVARTASVVEAVRSSGQEESEDLGVSGLCRQVDSLVPARSGQVGEGGVADHQGDDGQGAAHTGNVHTALTWGQRRSYICYIFDI